MKLLNLMTVLLGQIFAPHTHVHGSLVQVFGLGLLITGKSGVGKSEAALGLIERKHRLIADDIVKITKLENNTLIGQGVELTRHHMEIRGVGILHIPSLYGILCVCENSQIDIVVELETWDEHHTYDRFDIEDKTTEILGLKIHHHIIPVKPGRDIALLLETMVLNFRLKEAGYHSAKRLQQKVGEAIQKNSQRGI